MLEIELVPRTAWCKNIRSEVSKSEWDRLRKAAYKKANYKCEVCGEKGPKHPVECHEIFHYDDEKQIQTLTGLVALCPNCHACKHIGLAQIRGNYDKARKHLAKVNKWSIEQAEKYIQEQFVLWSARSEYQWELDISWLRNT
jgi:5-methylcytosine-specific restriction endonuclease McrA